MIRCQCPVDDRVFRNSGVHNSEVLLYRTLVKKSHAPGNSQVLDHLGERKQQG